MREISQEGLDGRGHIKEHPNMWYNIGRWALLLQNQEIDIDELCSIKAEAIKALGTIAFTNVNKVRGKNKIGAAYNKLAYTNVAMTLMQEEISIIKPKIIVCCGTWHPVASIVPNFDGKIYSMPHPAARKSTRAMLEDLKTQMEQN